MALTLRRSFPPRAGALLAAVVFAALSLGLGGCGDTPTDEQVNAAKPDLAIPNEPVTPGETSDNEPTGATGAAGGTGGDTGGTDTGGTTPQDTGGTDTGANNGTGGDTGNNNTGGGQQYDQFCQENPGACGD